MQKISAFLIAMLLILVPLNFGFFLLAPTIFSLRTISGLILIELTIMFVIFCRSEL